MATTGLSSRNHLPETTRGVDCIIYLSLLVMTDFVTKEARRFTPKCCKAVDNYLGRCMMIDLSAESRVNTGH